MTNLSINLELTCSATGERSNATLTLDRLPPLGRDLKREIEIAHEIPAFTQRLKYGGDGDLFASAEIADNEPVSRALLRNGDTLRVVYTSSADCKAVKRAVDYLEVLVASFKDQFPTPNDTTSTSAILLSQAFTGGTIQLLRNDLFMPWRSSVKQMNKEVFLRAGGLQYLLQLLRLVHTSNWATSSGHVRALEIILLETLHPLAASFKFRRLLVKEGVAELCFKSLLRHKLERRAVFREEITPYLLAKAMTTLCNLCELHETHVKIGSNTETLEQLICIAHSSHYDTWHAQVVLNLLACVAHAREIHPHLASDNVIRGIIDVCSFRSECGNCTDIELMLLRYYGQLVFIQLVLHSSSHISHSLLEKMGVFILDFMWDVDPAALAQEEQTSGNFWSVFEPFVALLYIPCPPAGETSGDSERNVLFRSLWHSSLHSALTTLRIIILCFDDGHKSLEIIRRENLIPYIILAPSHVPESLKPQATELVHCLGQHIKIQPPSLADLAKASLARYQFGLERMLHLQSPHELVFEYYGV